MISFLTTTSIIGLSVTVDRSALSQWFVVLPLFYQVFQVEPDSLGANPVPTTWQLCDLGQVPQFSQLLYKMGIVIAFTLWAVGR